MHGDHLYLLGRYTLEVSARVQARLGCRAGWGWALWGACGPGGEGGGMHVPTAQQVVCMAE